VGQLLVAFSASKARDRHKGAAVGTAHDELQVAVCVPTSWRSLLASFYPVPLCGFDGSSILSQSENSPAGSSKKQEEDEMQGRDKSPMIQIVLSVLGAKNFDVNIAARSERFKRNRGHGRT